MTPSNFNLILGILAGVILVIPFTGKVHDGRFKWFKGFTFRGWIMIIAFIISVIISYLKDQKIEKDEFNKAENAKKEKLISDSISRKLNDESTANTIKTIISALAKYNLKYDASQNKIIKLIKDSTGKSQKMYTVENPNLLISNIELTKTENGIHKFNITVLSQTAVSENINLQLYFASLEGNEYKYLKRQTYFFPKNSCLGVEEKFIATAYIYGLTISTKQYFIKINGTYENRDGKLFKVDRIYSYDIDANIFKIPSDPYYTDVKAFFDLNIKYSYSSSY